MCAVSKTRNKALWIALLVLLIAFAVSAVFPPQKKEKPLDDAPLLDQTGRDVRLKDFKDKVVLVNFIFTSCPHQGCNLMSLQFLRVQLMHKDKLGKELFLLSISIDPEKDTPETLKKFAEKYKADPSGWFFLTGPSETIETLRKSYGVEWTTGKDGKKRHTTIIALLDRKGDKAAVYNDSNYDTNKIVADIKNLLDGRPLQNIPVQQ